MIRIVKHILAFGAGLIAGRKTAPAPPDIVQPIQDPAWKPFFKRLAMLLPVLAVVGFLVAASGIVPIKASSGHWTITAWFLEFSMSRSIATHTVGMRAPPLDDRALVVKGAGHYESGCRPCHGGVEIQPTIPRQMTPHPPHLPPEISNWEPEELFYIVKHGIKFTGMPAWPARERDDEVWSVVAFLLRLPDLDATEYRRLVHGEPHEPGDEEPGPRSDPSPESDPSGTAIAGVAMGDADVRAASPQVPDVIRDHCGRCHGRGGEGREESAFPRLAGQQADYLFAALHAYARGNRHSGIMEPIAAAMSDDEMRAAARYFAGSEAHPRLAVYAPSEPAATADTATTSAAPVEGRADTSPAAGRAADTSSTGGGPSSPPSEADSSDAAERGREIAYVGIPRRNVPSCVDCHGPSETRRNPFYPILAGQFADYIVLQLRLFKERRRGGSAYAHIMHESVHRLTEAQMREVAHFYESLGETP